MDDPTTIWEVATAAGGPIFGSAERDDGKVDLTFVARGDHQGMALQSIFGGALQPFLPMERVGDSDVWVRTVQADARVRTTYGFLPDPPQIEMDVSRINEIIAEMMAYLPRVQHDPLNSRSTTMEMGGVGAFTQSVLEGPQAPEQPYSAIRPDQPTGKWHEDVIETARFAEPRKVWVRTPPGYDPSRPHALLVALDGQVWFQDPTVPVVLDNLVVDGAVTPLVSVLVDSLGMLERMTDLGLSDDFVGFLADDLVSWARKHYSISEDAADVLVAGMSMGGLASAFAGLRRPDVFGCVLPMSPSLFYPRDDQPDWLVARYAAAEAERLPRRIHLVVGSLEDTLAPLTRQLFETLDRKGVDVTFNEYVGGHDIPCWEGALADGLLRLLPSR